MALHHIKGEHLRKDGASITYIGTYNDGFNPGYDVKTYSNGDYLGDVKGQLTINMSEGLEDRMHTLICAAIDDRV